MRVRLFIALVCVLLIGAGAVIAQAPDCVSSPCTYLPSIRTDPTLTPVPTATPIPTPTPTEAPGLPQLKNGGFELGNNGDWTEIPGNAVITRFSPATPRSGQWLAWLGGENNANEEIAQTVTLPAGRPIYLHYWYRIDSIESDLNDDLIVYANTTVLADYSLSRTDDTYSHWDPGAVDLSAFAGQTLTIRFHVYTDNSDISSAFLDDIALSSHP